MKKSTFASAACVEHLLQQSVFGCIDPTYGGLNGLGNAGDLGGIVGGGGASGGGVDGGYVGHGGGGGGTNGEGDGGCDGEGGGGGTCPMTPYSHS